MKNFDEVFEKLVLDHSVTLNQLRSKCKKTLVLEKYHLLFSSIILIILESINYIVLYKDYHTLFYINSILLVLFLIAMLINYRNRKNVKYPALEQMKEADENLKEYINYFKNNLIKDLVNNVNENIYYSSSSGLDEKFYAKYFGLMDEKKYTKYSSEDYMKLDDIFMYDVGTFRNDTDLKKNEFTIFSGLVGIFKIENNIEGIIVPKNTNYYVNNLKCYGVKGKYMIYGDISNYINDEMLNVFKRFSEYTNTKFEIVIKDGYVCVRTHFSNIFDPNLYLGHLPKELLGEYYKYLKEFILFIKGVQNALKNK